MVTLVVIFCMALNPTMCRRLEIVPQDLHRIVSIPECIKGGAIGGMTFVLEHIEWRTRGWRCEERPALLQAWQRSGPN